MGKEWTRSKILLYLTYCSLTAHQHHNYHCINIIDAAQTPPLIRSDQIISSDILNISWTPNDNLWQFPDISQCSKPYLMSPDIPWQFQKASVSQSVVQWCCMKGEGDLHSYGWIRQCQGVISDILACFPPFPISICLSSIRSLTFFGVAGCPKSFQNQNVWTLRLFCHILEPSTTFWSWNIRF